VDTDIATHIQLLKHRISSINAESARYKELKEDKYYIPEDWNIPITSDVSHPYLKHFDNWDEVLQAYTDLGNTLYHLALKDLAPRLGRKRAKESARFFKTYNSQITADVMFNLRSFHNFLSQRMDDHAQKEIQEIAFQMYEIISNLEGNPFEHTLKAWNIKPDISG
jgi:thymidylate synthase (FAD)